MSNWQIAALLDLHRDTVNRHVRLLKIQNRPEAPPGDFAGIPLADAAQPVCADRFGAGGSGSIAECSCSRLGTSSSGAKAEGPTSDVIWEDAEHVMPGGQPLLKTGHGSRLRRSRKTGQRRPPGKSRSLSCLIMSRACPSPAGKIHSGRFESRSRASETCQRRPSG